MFVSLYSPRPNQQSDGFPLEFVSKDLKQNCEQSAKIANKRSQNCKENCEQTGISDL